MQKEQSAIKNKGFSIVEIILAIAIFFIFLTAFSEMTFGFWKQQRNALNKERATYLAEEAFEAARSLRDASFSNLTDGNHGLSIVSNKWSFSGTSDTSDVFQRALTISTIDTNTKKADVVISWTDETGNNSVSLSTYLTNWRKITPPPGITVNKTVTNHGMSKTTADFAPYKVGTTTVTLGISATVSPGTYAVTETTDSSYTTTFSGDCDSGGNITLNLGDAKVCNITNEEKPSQLTVTKVVSGGSKVVSDFSLFVDATPVTSGATNTFNSGSHTVSETPDPSYTGTFTGDCNSSGVVTLVAGTTKSCTLTNTLSAVVPTVTSPTATSVGQTTATLGANVTSLGVPASISARGTCWGTSPSPVTNCAAEGGTTTGVFTQARTGFACNTAYYYRGYATNTTGTGYSADGTFTTSSCITFVNKATSTTTTITIPAHNVGDLLIMFAYRSNSNTPPTVPSGWTTIDASGAANNSSSLAYRIATGSDTSGTWTNANELILQIYRGTNASPIGAFAAQHANSTTVTYPALSLQVTNGTSWIIGSAGAASATSTVEVAPTGMTARSDVIGTSHEAAGFDTNGGVSSWTAKTVNISASNTKWSAKTLEIKSQ